MHDRGHTITELLRTIVLVTLVAILVWVFAEAESLTTRTIHPEIIFETDQGATLLLEIDDPGWRDRPDLTIEGSTAAVAAAESTLVKPIRLRPGMEGIPVSPGEYQIDIRAALRDATELAGKGVTVSRVDPPMVRVRLQQIEERQVRVQVDTTGLDVESPPQAKPATVTVRVPSRQAVLLTDATFVRAKVSAESLQKLVPGRRETVTNVPLELPPELSSSNIHIEPARVEVQLTVRNRTASLTLPSVPVYVTIAAVESGRWNITIPEEDRFIPDVKVIGPSDAVDRVRRGEYRVTAQVILSFDDLERGITSKEVTFGDMPSSLSFKADMSIVRVRIERKPAEAPK